VKYAKYGTIVLVLVFMISAGTQQAAAQEETFKGTFNLPTEAYWGSTLLPPGEYSIALSLDQTRTVPLVRLTGDGLRAWILTGPAASKEVTEHSKLLLENINGVYVIRHLDAGIVGRSYVFAVSKSVYKNAHMKAVRAGNEPSPVSVPIAANGAF
jgi:hypothetical protein